MLRVTYLHLKEYRDFLGGEMLYTMIKELFLRSNLVDLGHDLSYVLNNKLGSRLVNETGLPRKAQLFLHQASQSHEAELVRYYNKLAMKEHGSEEDIWIESAANCAGVPFLCLSRSMDVGVEVC